MEIKLKRYSSRSDSTAGLLFVNDLFFCYTIEDQKQERKVPGETRIPTGRYEIKFRDAGGMNERYKKKYSDHIGMLHLQDVPEFEWIYIHPGNNDDHTTGCILVGYGTNFKVEHTVQRSVDAYQMLYTLCRLATDQGEQIHIIVEDLC